MSIQFEFADWYVNCSDIEQWLFRKCCQIVEVWFPQGFIIIKSLFQTKEDFTGSKGLDLAGLELVSYFLNQNQDQIIPLRPCLESDSPLIKDSFLLSITLLFLSFLFFLQWIIWSPQGFDKQSSIVCHR